MGKYCDTKGKNYTCDSEKFDPKSRAQYRMLSPSPLFPDAVTCEFGDLSGMAGPIKGRNGKYAVEKHEKHGEAMMSATFGEISPWTLDKNHAFTTLLPSSPLRKRMSRPQTSIPWTSYHMMPVS